MSVVRFAPAIHTPKPPQQVSIIIGALAASLDLNAEPGTYAVTGTDATLARGLFINAEPGSFAITGTDATLVTERPLNAEPGAYTISGLDAALEFTGAPVAPRNTALIVKAHTPKPRQQVSQTISGLAPAAVYELNAEPGTYAINGIDVQLAHEVPTTWDRIVSPNYAHQTQQIVYGTRQFYGVEVILGDFSLNAEPGSYAVTGSNATLARGLFVNAEPGVYTISGVAASLVRDISINAEPGVYSITGVAATVARAISINAESGAHTITGVSAELTHGTPGVYTLQADPGVYTITGFDATLVSVRLINAAPTSYALTGVATGLALERTVLADPGAYTVTGVANSMLLTRVLDANTGSYAIAGFTAALGDVISIGHFDQPTPSADGYSVGPEASVFDSPTPGVVRT